MTTKKTGNLERCIREADDFLEVAMYCVDQSKQSTFRLLFPLFVNGALACELYLKAIAMIESSDCSFERGHHLEELFAKISLSAQQEVRENYAKKNIYIPLDALLSKYGNNFIEWRYSFENGSEGNRVGIIGLAESLKEYVYANK